MATSSATNIFTEDQEIHLGDAIAEHIQHNFRVIDDAEVTGYLNQVGGRIIKHLPATELQFRFLIVDLPEANAFVLPGGRIYVSRKLIAFARSEDELASVISHEIGHLIHRDGTIEMTRRLREVLGVTQVTDRRDIFQKYNQLVDNAARKPRAFARSNNHEDKEQIVADQIGLFALASAGYDPQAHVRFWDRFAETKGKTGGFFSDLFGTTKPESKRLRELVAGVAAMPAACIESRAATSTEGFGKWQAAVVNFTGTGRREALHGVLSKTTLEPPLRGEITHIRFSPDGKHLLAQDDSGINVLTRNPFALLFRAEAPEAEPAQFTSDSTSIVFHNSEMRVETWSLADRKLQIAREIVARKRCLQTSLAPDGKTLACLDTNLDLTLFDVESSAVIFQKKQFYVPDFIEILLLRLFSVMSEQAGDTNIEWINMGFSPDARYFVAAQRGLAQGAFGKLTTETSAAAFDLTTRTPVTLRNPLKKLIGGGFAFVGSDKLIDINRAEPQKSALVTFPAGEVIEELPLGRAKVAAATSGNYAIIRPIGKFPVGVMDISTKKIFMAHKQAALDIHDTVFAAESVNGEIGLYTVGKDETLGL